MRILWITPGFAADAQDHNCIPPLQLLARSLLQKGVHLTVIALEYPFKAQAYDWPDLAPKGVVFPCNGRNRRWLRWRSFRRAIVFAGQAHADQKFDAIHSFWLGPAWVLGKRLAARWQLPHWTTLMGQDVLPKNRYIRSLKPDQTAHLIAVSHFQNDRLEKTCGLRAAHCILWGIPDKDIPPRLPDNRPVDVLGVGSLIPVKNWTLWLRVLRLVADQHPTLSAELIGDGPEMSRLRELANRMGLQNNLRFTGNVPREEVLNWMQKSRVLLHTARFESFGFVFAEAAASGCRIVSTPVGAATEFGACAETEGALAVAVRHALLMPTVEKPAIPIRIQDTADAYLQLYQG